MTCKLSGLNLSSVYQKLFLTEKRSDCDNKMASTRRTSTKHVLQQGFVFECFQSFAPLLVLIIVVECTYGNGHQLVEHSPKNGRYRSADGLLKTSKKSLTHEEALEEHPDRNHEGLGHVQLHRDRRDSIVVRPLGVTRQRDARRKQQRGSKREQRPAKSPKETLT